MTDESAVHEDTIGPPEEANRKCRKCGRLLPLDQFHKSGPQKRVDASTARTAYEMGYRSDEGEWPEIQRALTIGMICLKKALRPYIGELE